MNNTENTTKSELGCFAIWEGAQGQKTEILADLENNFDILGIFEVYWSEKNYNSNFERLYERPQTGNEFKNYNRKLGKPPFTFIIVRDNKPQNKYSISVSGQVELNNQNIVSSKARYRAMFAQPYLVHSSNNEKELLFQAPMILGVDLFHETTNAKVPIIKTINKDLEGADSWLNWGHFFSLVNLSEDYVILRNHDEISDNFEGGDVDILCSNLQRFCSISNIFQFKGRRYKGHTQINNKKIKFDVRFIGDGYLPEKWETNILNNKNYNGKFYVPNELDLYFSLIFHCATHKTNISDKYKSLLMELEEKLDINILNSNNITVESLGGVISGYMRSMGYLFQEPLDTNVHLNQKIIASFPSKYDFLKEKPLRKLSRKLLRKLS